MTEPPQPGDTKPRDEEARGALDRPPSERYGAKVPASPETAGRSGAGPGAAVLAALLGAVGIAVLGGPLSITAGNIVLAGVIGWAVGTGAGPGRRAAAAALAAASVVIGFVGVWLYSRWEGGVLGPIDYLLEVEGVVVPLAIVAAVVLAWLAAPSAKSSASSSSSPS